MGGGGKASPNEIFLKAVYFTMLTVAADLRFFVPIRTFLPLFTVFWAKSCLLKENNKSPNLAKIHHLVSQNKLLDKKLADLIIPP